MQWLAFCVIWCPQKSQNMTSLFSSVSRNERRLTPTIWPYLFWLPLQDFTLWTLFFRVTSPCHGLQPPRALTDMFCVWLINRYRGCVEQQAGKRRKKKPGAFKMFPHRPHWYQTVCNSWHFIIYCQHLKCTLSSIKPTGWRLFHLVWFYSQQSLGFYPALTKLSGAACVRLYVSFFVR